MNVTQKVEQLLDENHPIILDMKLVKLLKMDDLRDLFESIHEWGNSRDFTYSSLPRTHVTQRYLRTWLKETYLD